MCAVSGSGEQRYGPLLRLRKSASAPNSDRRTRGRSRPERRTLRPVATRWAPTAHRPPLSRGVRALHARYTARRTPPASSCGAGPRVQQPIRGPGARRRAIDASPGRASVKSSSGTLATPIHMQRGGGAPAARSRPFRQRRHRSRVTRRALHSSQRSGARSAGGAAPCRARQRPGDGGRDFCFEPCAR
jgi:hypothetical protein